MRRCSDLHVFENLSNMVEEVEKFMNPDILFRIKNIKLKDCMIFLEIFM